MEKIIHEFLISTNQKFQNYFPYLEEEILQVFCFLLHRLLLLLREPLSNMLARRDRSDDDEDDVFEPEQHISAHLFNKVAPFTSIIRHRVMPSIGSQTQTIRSESLISSLFITTEKFVKLLISFLCLSSSYLDSLVFIDRWKSIAQRDSIQRATQPANHNNDAWPDFAR